LQDNELGYLGEIEDDYWWNEGRRKILCDLIYEQVNESKNLEILDVGCGPGGTSIAFFQFGNVTGTDISFSGLKLAKEKGLTNVVVSSSTSIPFQSEKFDIITILDVIEHVQKHKTVLKEIWRMLKPNGIIVVTVPAYQFLWSQHDVASSHVRRYNNSTITKELKDSQFKIIRTSYFVSFLFPLIAIYRLITKNRINKKNPKGDLIKFPQPINNFFKKLMSIENKLLKKINLPFGLSVVCIAKKDTNTNL